MKITCLPFRQPHTLKSILIVFLLIPFSATWILANNIQVSNISLENHNAGYNTYNARFDLTWENSWRTSTFESNWDAAWIVIKYREIPNTTWR